ncbi:hypothetical protein [Agrococcus beijingensis]|nr:hypothetical protein [Agrococcus sp. REN33]
MGRIERIQRRVSLTVEERHHARLEAERNQRQYDRVRAEAMIQRGWI